MTNKGNRKIKPTKKIVFIIAILLLVPILLFLFHRPIRVIFPEIVGFVKIEEGLYLDEENRAEEARVLREQSLQYIEREFGKFKKEPKIIFCAEQESFEKFGFKKSAARSVATYGVVISPRAWELYYIKHELIHYWQIENLGLINFYPQWLVEGMAYSLSGDPRTPLDEPWETYREEFNTWYEQIDKDQLIMEIKAIKKSN